MFESWARDYRREHQAYIKWDADCLGRTSHGICRIGKFHLNPRRDQAQIYDSKLKAFRAVTEKDTSSISATACSKALRHLPYGATLELYFGNLPEKDRESFRKAFPEAKEIPEDD